MAAMMTGLLALAPACVGPGVGHEDEPLAAKVVPKTAFANDQPVFDYFRTQGFTTFQAAGIVGNLDQESGINPTISQDGGGPGRGIAQWSAGGRWDTDPGDNCVAFAATEGKSADTLQVQLDFIMFELNSFSDYGLAKLKASTNVSDAATDFELGFEGCAIADECDGPQRISYAMDVLAAYANDPVKTADGGATPSGDMATGPTTPPGDDMASGGATSGSDMAKAGSGGGSGGSGGGSGTGTSPVTPAGKHGGCAMAGADAGAPGAWLLVLAFAAALARRRRLSAR